MRSQTMNIDYVYNYTLYAYTVMLSMVNHLMYCTLEFAELAGALVHMVYKEWTITVRAQLVELVHCYTGYCFIDDVHLYAKVLLLLFPGASVCLNDKLCFSTKLLQDLNETQESWYHYGVQRQKEPIADLKEIQVASERDIIDSTSYHGNEWRQLWYIFCILY